MNGHIRTSCRLAAVLAGTVALGLSVQSQAMDKNTEAVLIGFCKASMNNDLIQLRSDIRHYRLSFSQVADNVVCNDQSIANFAASYGATRTSSALANKMSARPVTEIKDLSKVSDPAWSVSFEVGK
ncbi:DUF3718 domain-containing protein [Alteromonas sp. CYL-A6]|uniref:DUF3718 domain-containing protein n=1 Tax=Alteromonas nitratireducens TaxID=3390813 RepID=UPI0034B2AD68